MDIVARVKGIITKPKDEWVKIKEEPSNITTLFTSYAVILAAIPAVASFIGRAFIGYSVPFVGWIRMGVGRALLYAIFSYIFSLIGVYIIGLIIYFLAPSFSSKKDNIQAMDKFKLKKGLIITKDFLSEEKINNKKVIYKPFWLWTLKNE
ncbi:YIP1 family protein [Candidatus Aminicenantes bacterium AC-335-A11]|nr:YIP1 family protein [Candidatus Aminicenantes bacterium AC-335-A11]